MLNPNKEVRNAIISAEPKLGRVELFKKIKMIAWQHVTTSPKDWISAFKYQVVMLLAAFVIKKISKLSDFLLHKFHSIFQFWMLAELSLSRGD